MLGDEWKVRAWGFAAYAQLLSWGCSFDESASTVIRFPYCTASSEKSPRQITRDRVKCGSSDFAAGKSIDRDFALIRSRRASSTAWTFLNNFSDLPPQWYLLCLFDSDSALVVNLGKQDLSRFGLRYWWLSVATPYIQPRRLHLFPQRLVKVLW